MPTSSFSCSFYGEIVQLIGSRSSLWSWPFPLLGNPPTIRYRYFFTSFLLKIDWLKKEFWNKQYKQRLKDGQSEGFDYLLSFEELYPQLQYLLPTKPYTFLNLGCGMSDFSIELYQATRLPSMIYEVDFSTEALKHSQKLFIRNYVSPLNRDTISGVGSNESFKLAYVSFIQALAQRLPFRDDSMDIILDKGKWPLSAQYL